MKRAGAVRVRVRTCIGRYGVGCFGMRSHRAKFLEPLLPPGVARGFGALPAILQCRPTATV